MYFLRDVSIYEAKRAILEEKNKYNPTKVQKASLVMLLKPFMGKPKKKKKRG